jgi:PIN domain nuclease of toxin-antitoxin system
MRYLLDTHAFLWFVTANPRLSATARQTILSPAQEIFLSIVTPWEIAIKVGLGKLVLSEPLAVYIPRELKRNQIQLLPVTIDHTATVSALPPHHRDPFDRMLIAQALTEGIPVLSADRAFDPYGVTRLW